MKKQNLTGYIQYYKKNGGTDTKAMYQTEKSFRQLCVIFTKKKCCTTLHPQKFGCTPNNEGKRVHVPPDEKTCGHAVPITTKVVSSNPTHGEVYTIQHVINVVSDLWQVSGFLRVLWLPPPIKLTATIYLKYC